MTNVSRRGFLGMLGAALAMPVIPAAPKRSFFSFFVPAVKPLPEFNLQAEMDRVSKEGGGVLKLPEGMFIIGKSLLLPHNVSLDFEGSGAIVDCHVTIGMAKADHGGTRVRSIFIDRPAPNGPRAIVSNCYFDFEESPGRPMFEVLEDRAKGSS